MMICETIDRQPEAFKLIYSQLNHLGKKTFMILLKNIACEPFNQAQLEKCPLNTLSGAEVMVGLLQLRQKKIIRTMRKKRGDFIHQLPLEHFPLWQSVVLGNLFLDTPETKVEVSHRFRRGLLLDLFQLLVYIAKHELPLTNKGVIHKRHFFKISEGLDLKEEDLEHITVHYSERDLYSIPFAIVYDMALRLGLIELMADKVVLKRNQIHSFFAQSNERIHHCLYTIWLMRFLPRQAWMQHAIAVMVPFAPLGQWFCLDQIAEYLKTNEITMDNLEKEEAMIQFKQQWIHPLVALGWLELGKDSQSNEWGRWLISLNISNSSQHLQVNREHEVLVQPNFEIIAPLTLSIEYRWELECFAEHVQTDRVSRYVLTKDSLDRAYKNGRTVGDITGYLQKYGKYGIPENVEVTIAQWGKQFEVEGWRKPPFYPKWAATEHIQPFAWPKEATNKGMLSPRFDSDDYEEVTNLPKIEAMYDKLAEIPPIWLKDHREYHISVRKEIITKAIEWKTYIRIRETGQLKTVIPKEIIPNHGSWNVQCLLDGRKTQLSPDDLKSLLLILPGINDGSE